MDLKQIQELIRFVQKSGVSEVKLEEGDFKITIKTQSDVRYVAPPTYMVAPPTVTPQAVAAPAPVQSSPVAEAPVAKPAEAPAASNDLTIKSPMIGTFYRKPGPDKEPFIKVGDKVSKGQVVCVIEAMKLFNEIEAEVSGTVVKVLADDQSPVEYDQPLFLISPN